MRNILLAFLLFLTACESRKTASMESINPPAEAIAFPADDTAIPPTADSVIAANTIADSNKGSFALADTVLTVTAEDKVLIEAFAQSGAGRNCASISVIKRAIGRYGIANVFSKVDSSATGYSVLLRDGKSVTLTRAEAQTVGQFDNFRLKNDAAIYRAARFIYAVMAKNKFSTDNASKPGTWPNMESVVNQGGKYHLLIASTEKNFALLGLGENYLYSSANNAYSKPSVILVNRKHSAYGGMGYYDEYGRVVSAKRFARNHGNRKLLGIYELIK
jgi:hypothetical protein